MKKLKILTRTIEVSKVPLDDIENELTWQEARLSRHFPRRLRHQSA